MGLSKGNGTQRQKRITDHHFLDLSPTPHGMIPSLKVGSLFETILTYIFMLCTLSFTMKNAFVHRCPVSFFARSAIRCYHPSRSCPTKDELPHASSVKIVLKSWEKDIGGLKVGRVLPSLAARSVGPFIFFDHIGPTTLEMGSGLDVRPHPHIGLATVTYLFEGAIMHRDSLGYRQEIVPGDVNWMTAGRGIVHSERSPDIKRAQRQRIHGIQTWVALPVAHEDADPSFEHHPQHTIPELMLNGVTVRIIAGSAFDRSSPVRTYSKTLYATAKFAPNSYLILDTEHEERSIYLVDGDLSIDGVSLERIHMAVLHPGVSVKVSSMQGAIVMILGGEKLDRQRFMEWNFVSSSREKIEKAKLAWSRQEMGKIPGETEWITYPDRRDAK